MKRKLITLSAILMALCLLFVSCDNSTNELETQSEIPTWAVGEYTGTKGFTIGAPLIITDESFSITVLNMAVAATVDKIENSSYSDRSWSATLIDVNIPQKDESVLPVGDVGVTVTMPEQTSGEAAQKKLNVTVELTGVLASFNPQLVDLEFTENTPATE